MGKVDSRRLDASQWRRASSRVQQFCGQFAAGGDARRSTGNHRGGPASNFAWLIACNAVVSFRRSASARSFASGACSMRLRNAARIPPSSESNRRHGCGSSPVRWRSLRPFSASTLRCSSPWHWLAFRCSTILRARISCIGEPISGRYTVSGQWWRLLTCVFVHGGLLHIAFNMWCLWNLGRLAESVYGHWTFAAVYLISWLGGEPREPDLESRRLERRRFRSDLRDCRGSDRIVLSG